MLAIRSSETSVLTRTTLRIIPEDGILNIQRIFFEMTIASSSFVEESDL
jgi:hypothetical protein